ncbi:MULTISPECIES: EAL domain-containing protein [unclassified Nostoc]|uniref:bifunctional diguanylate cyclase/phosphodiesterase n=1 Tax=unclassified Nostoc TaxID=2593658 RepID=UPI0025AA52B4|nr:MULTISPECIES: EAL domain-containing protein [unclassified Nostoc]MDM9581685.1 EAL domain-containing protein [Nostoc sp. GT001]MDZ7947089.1 EAL domain-containing protein [Nostoc sp. EfeVER01]MDZ7991514.1 EAL domain-containing protein [Nostoc sp. EspVER01]
MRQQNFLRSIPKGFLRVPLRVALVVPFVVQISVAVGLTAFLSLKNGQKAVNDVATQLRNEVTTRIHQHVTNYIEIPQLVTQINANAVHIGQLSLKDAKSLERHLWNQMQLFKPLKPIAFASTQGEIHSVDRLNDGSLVIRKRDQSTGYNYYTYTTDNQGNIVRLLQVNPTFDPRTRPWYTNAVKAGKTTCTEIYSYFSSSGLAFSATQPLYNQTGTLLGVTNATLSLSQLSEFLHSLKIGRSGKTFIVEHSGELVATSTAEQPFILSHEGGKKKSKRLRAIASSDRITHLTTQYLHSKFGNFRNISSRRQLEFEIDQKRQFVQLMPLTADCGLNWLIIVVVPEADFMEHIEANTRTTMLLCLGALILATAIGVITSHWITQPILFLSIASQEIANGKLDQTVTVEGINEIRVLAQAHNQMAAQLQDSFAGLLEANRQLEAEINERKQVEEQLRHNAFHDALTGLPNRAFFMESLKHTLQRAKRQKSYLFAVLFLDLDRFKVINDSLGHLKGDQFLIAIANRLEVCIRSTDIAARLGGDEFTILLDEIQNVSEAIKVAERIQQELTLPLELDGQEVFTTASIGIALSSTVDYDQPENLLRDADTAMYRAKALGKARYELFNQEMYTNALVRLQLENDLRRAIERQEFQLYYQPIVSLTNGRLIGFEALIRWQHPERGFVSPTDFIPLVEETGMIVELGYWTLYEACRQMQSWQVSHPTNSLEKISVNLSVKQFSQRDLIEQIGEILHSTGLDASSLMLEITESAIMENGDEANAALSEFRKMGIKLSIDDFGTGYSSLSRLHSFPISLLKIDRSFVSPIDGNGKNLEIIEIIITLAHKLGMDVTAEGVETKEQLAFLKKLNCEYGQGYFFSRPLDKTAALALIVKNLQW